MWFPVLQSIKPAVRRSATRRTSSTELARRSSSELEPLNITGTDFSLGKLPAADKQLKAEVVLKLCQQEWQPRLLILTQDDLIIAHQESSTISDKIPLHEVRLISKSMKDDLTEESVNTAFNVHTTQEGYNCGRDYCFSTTTEEESLLWMRLLATASKKALKRIENRTKLQSLRLRVRNLTGSLAWQRGNGVLIAINLCINIAQSQADPASNNDITSIFDTLDIIFTSVFAAELAMNLVGYWFWTFFTDGWLVFDLIVVSISIVSLLLRDLPGVSILRLMRTFRVLRLFNKLKSLRTIINALAASLLPVFNAFLLVILMCVIYAILGVQLFAEDSPDTFGTFLLSYWTMFQVSTFDGWSDIAIKLSEGGPYLIDPVVAIFFITFIGIVCWILIPVVVAILLDNFVRAVSVEKFKVSMDEEEAQLKAMGLSRVQQSNPLDPLLESLSGFKDQADLKRRIGSLFHALDIDRGGTLSFSEIQQGLRKMERFQPRIHISIEDYERLTRNGALCDDSGEISSEQFEIILREEVFAFLQSRVSESHSKKDFLDELNAAILGALKLLLIRSTAANSDRDSSQIDLEKIVQAFRTELREARCEMRAARIEFQGTRCKVRRHFNGMRRKGNWLSRRARWNSLIAIDHSIDTMDPTDFQKKNERKQLSNFLETQLNPGSSPAFRSAYHDLQTLIDRDLETSCQLETAAKVILTESTPEIPQNQSDDLTEIQRNIDFLSASRLHEAGNGVMATSAAYPKRWQLCVPTPQNSEQDKLMEEGEESSNCKDLECNFSYCAKEPYCVVYISRRSCVTRRMGKRLPFKVNNENRQRSIRSPERLKGCPPSGVRSCRNDAHGRKIYNALNGCTKRLPHQSCRDTLGPANIGLTKTAKSPRTENIPSIPKLIQMHSEILESYNKQVVEKEKSKLLLAEASLLPPNTHLVNRGDRRDLLPEPISLHESSCLDETGTQQVLQNGRESSKEEANFRSWTLTDTPWNEGAVNTKASPMPAFLYSDLVFTEGFQRASQPPQSLKSVPATTTWAF